MATRCDACGREEYMPFVCKMCRQRFCAEHRLPENHDCQGLPEYRSRARTEGRLYASPHEDPIMVKPSRFAGLGSRVGTAFDRLEGRVTYVLLGLMAATFVLEMLTTAVRPDLFRATFVLSTDFWLRPWTIVTSVFAHAGFYHLFGNGIVLFFFGTTLEGLIGSKRFFWLFMGSGVLAGLAEVGVFGFFLDAVLPGYDFGRSVLGASGGVMGVLGALTVLAPRLTVLVFFVFPAPLWLITLLYALLDLTLLGTGDRVAHLAHLAGLAVGLAYGKHLRDQGLRARIQQEPGIRWRRYT